MNNYWVTNFNPDQKGQHEWTYYLTSGSDVSDGAATRFGWGTRVPFLTRVLPGGGTGEPVWQKSLISGWPENVILVNARPAEDENGIFLQVRETDGKPVNLASLKQISGTPFKITQVNAIGDNISGGTTVLKPLGSGFYKLNW